MSMAGYTKLFNSILASTIWRAPNTTRIVWITMLAMADKDGVVEGSVPGLADFARISVDEARTALGELLAPDPDSRTSEHEGRRIEALDGTGWRLLNHGKYRAKMSDDERREYNRQKQAEWRGRKKVSKNVNDSQSLSAMSAHTEAEAQAKADKTTPPNPQGGNCGYSPDFNDFWTRYPNKIGKGAAWKAWMRAKGKPPIVDLIAAVRRDQATDRWKKNGGEFIPHPATWLNQRRWEDSGLTLERNHQTDVSDWHEEKAKWAKPIT